MDYIKIMMLASIAVLICGFLKNTGSSFHVYAAVFISALIMMIVLVKLYSLLESINRFTVYLKNSNEYLSLLIKIVLITYVTSFTSDLCRDSGYTSVADQIEIFGKITIAALSVPVILELLNLTVIEAFGEEITDGINFNEVDNSLKQAGLGELSFEDIVLKIINGDFSIIDLIKNIFRNQINNFNNYKSILINILMLALLSGIFKVISISSNVNMEGTARLIIVINLILILTKMFWECLKITQSTIQNSLLVYESIMPVFLSCVFCITGSITYAAYYQIFLMGEVIVNNVFNNFLLTMIKADYYLHITNRLSMTDRFSKLCELIELIVKWTCRLVIIIFTGLSCVKGLMAPLSDSFKKKMFYKTAKIIPGVGDSLEAMSQAVYGSGIIIKNGIGISGIVVVIVIAAAPVLQLLIYFILLKITSALLQPLAEKTFIQVIESVAVIIGLMILLVSVTGFLFIILIALICGFTNSSV